MPSTQIKICVFSCCALKRAKWHFLLVMNNSQPFTCPSPPQEYERLAAQMDGAKTDLTKKVNDITKAAAKEDLVVAAEKHAKELMKLAKKLEE